MIRYGGKEYDYDIDNVGIDELREIKRKLKLTARGLFEGLEQLDPDAMTALYWVLMRSDGQHDDLVLSDSLQFRPMELMQAWAESTEEDAKAAEADPTLAATLPDGMTPEPTGSSTATSKSSALSTSSRSPATAA